MRPLEFLLRTNRSIGPTLLRWGLALVMFPHAAQKVFGWFGGGGFSGTMHFFTSNLHIPAPLAFLAILTEFLGVIGLALGLFTRVAALGIGFVLLVAALLVHVQHGFFMNWAGKQAGEGFEYHVLVMAMAIVLVIHGGGSAALDSILLRRAAGVPPAPKDEF
jgi:putative oxidoreductase